MFLSSDNIIFFLDQGWFSFLLCPALTPKKKVEISYVTPFALDFLNPTTLFPRVKNFSLLTLRLGKLLLM